MRRWKDEMGPVSSKVVNNLRTDIHSDRGCQALTKPGQIEAIGKSQAVWLIILIMDGTINSERMTKFLTPGILPSQTRVGRETSIVGFAETSTKTVPWNNRQFWQDLKQRRQYHQRQSTSVIGKGGKIVLDPVLVQPINGTLNGKPFKVVKYVPADITGRKNL